MIHINANRALKDGRNDHHVMVESIQPSKLTIVPTGLDLLRKHTRDLVYIFGEDDKDMPYAQK